jgi:phosphoribosylformylglycinamidine synthase I
MKAGIVVFPGTNCDRDTLLACQEFGWEAEYIWHFETNLNGYDIIFLPGGFSYGDYIRSGRLAKFSPVMQAVKKFVDKKQGFLIGICNGFQILCETGFLPGVLTDNWNTRFICKTQELKLNDGKNDKWIKLPIAHGEGRYLAEVDVIERLKNEDMIFLTYKNNPNGSMENIAGLYDKKRKIIGMMPHPERAFFNETGNVDGKKIFKIIEKGLNNDN